MKKNILLVITFLLSIASIAQESNLLICYKVIDKTNRIEPANNWSDISPEYYLYSIQGKGKAINFYATNKIDETKNLTERIRKSGFSLLNIDSGYKITYDPTQFEEWRKEPFRKFTFLTSERFPQNILNFPCLSARLIDDLSDTIQVFTTYKLPKESSLIFFEKSQDPVIKIISKNYEVYPEYIKEINFSFSSLENNIPGNLKLDSKPYQFTFEGGSGFPEKNYPIHPFTVRKDNYTFLDLGDIKTYKAIILFFSGRFNVKDNAVPRLSSLLDRYYEGIQRNMKTIAKEIGNRDSVIAVFISEEDKSVMDFDPKYRFLKSFSRIKKIPSATEIFNFYQITNTPEVFIIGSNGIVKDIYTQHFMAGDLTFEEFLKKHLD